MYRFIGGHMISTCTLFFMVSMTQHFRFVLFDYMNVLLRLLKFNNCCQNKLISVSVSVSVNNVCQLNTELEPNTHQCRSEHLGE